MGKMRLGILAGVLGCALIVGCGAGEMAEESVGSSTESSMESPADETGLDEKRIESVEEGELVSAAEFSDYYGMEEGEIPEDYLEAFIGHRQLTEGALSERNYDAMVRELYERGVTFGSTVSELISGEEEAFSEDDDFSDVAYIVLQKDRYEDGTDMVTPQLVILEVENQKVYITKMNVTDDYTTEENVRELSKEDVGECLLRLRDMITKDWDNYHSVEGKAYDWKLHVVKADGTVISFSGEGPDEEFHPGFVKWCEDYLE